MGDAAVAVLVKEVVGRLTSLAIQEFGLLWGLKDDILSLKKDFDHIEAVLEDAEQKHIKERDVELWLRDLRSASVMVENVLDEVSAETLLQRLHKRRGVKYMVRAFFSSNHNQFMSCVRIAHKVKAIRRKLDVIASKRFALKLTPSGAISHVDDVGVAGEMPDRETSSLIHDSSVILGRDQETEMITKKLCNKDTGKHDNGEIRVYGIWGMGGLGKTTLAQLVYNHEMVGRYFELKYWVYVSQNFQVKEIIRKIIESIDKCGCTLTQLDTLQGSLQDKLRGKKFLIVLDDVWIEEDEKAKWEDLSKTLSCGAEESIVVMTTRSTTTSRMMAKVSELQHELGCLSKEDSWVLFKKFAFAQGREGDAISELEPIGMEIVEKCKGLPLAVKTMGSLMWSKRSTMEWEHVKGNIIWNLQENKVLPALKLSYDNLLPHLKRCFAYCCLFSKGHGMKKDEVVQLWVVNGFIPVRGETDLYVIGEEIFNCLVWRSFFQVVKGIFYNDHVNRYEMHDLMNDMARHVMRHDCLTIESGKEVLVPDEVLHLSSSCPDFLFSSQDLGNLTSLRSILKLGKINESLLSQNFNNVYLRVLYLPELKKLPKSICKLKHLKYLNLSHSDIRVLPESIIYLQNLQILILYGCYFLRKLPKGLRFMRNLQHLDIRCSYFLEHLPSGIKEVTSLRILPRFPVGNKGGAKIGELGDLNLLAGELEISGLGNVGGLSEAKNANLKCKKNISFLVLQWYERESRRKSLSYGEEVLEGLEPNPSLKRFIISFYREKNISPSWMIKLSDLVEISFYDCKKCEYIFALGRLPNLRIIEFARMDSLKCFHDDANNTLGDTSNSFLCVEELHIRICPSLVSLPSNLPKLKVLILVKCTNLLSLPDEIQSFKDMKTLDIAGCPNLSEKYEKEIGVEWPKISHIPDITFCSQGYSGESASESENQSDE